MGFGSFYKGEKKKQKQNKKGNIMQTSDAPIFTEPKRVEKKKKWEE